VAQQGGRFLLVETVPEMVNAWRRAPLPHEYFPIPSLTAYSLVFGRPRSYHGPSAAAVVTKGVVG
jgi:hypothetical protein